MRESFLQAAKCFALLLLLFLSGCSAISSTFNSTLNLVGAGSHNALKSIAIEASSDSNSTAAVSVDILFVTDDSVTSLLLKMSGPDWFINNKVAMMKRYDKEISLISLEIVPLTVKESIVLPENHKKAKNIIMFANYRNTDGQYVADISHFKSLKIQLLKKNYELVEEKK